MISVRSLLIVLLANVATHSAWAVDFVADVQPILAAHCVKCHGGVKQGGNVSFINHASTLAPAKSGKRPIVPSSPQRSELVARITAIDEHERMPAEGPALSASQVKVLKQWIAEGAK